MNRKSIFLFIIAVLLIPSLTVRAQSTPPAPQDLVNAVNALRKEKDLAPLIVDGALSKIAQEHAEYMAENNFITNIGQGNTRPRDRAMQTGYGAGADIVVTESIATAQMAATINTILNSVWSNPTDQGSIYNPKAVHIGAGIAEHNGQLYYTLDIGYIVSDSAAYTPFPTVGAGTPLPTLKITVNTQPPLFTAAPLPDGMILHTVKQGETVWEIALAYNLPLEALAAQNNLDLKTLLIFENQKLLIRPAFTATVTPTITQTPRPPTRTPRPTFTQRPTQPTFTPTQTGTATSEPVLPQISNNRRLIGTGLILISLFGLIGTIVSYIRRRNENSNMPDNQEPSKPGE